MFDEGRSFCAAFRERPSRFRSRSRCRVRRSPGSASPAGGASSTTICPAGSEPNHPYALDLDLFGTGCLFELLCTAKTRIGEQTLADWLLSPAPLDEVHQRQAAVQELRPRLDLREELSHLAAEIPTGNHLEALAEWGNQEPVLISP